MKCPFCGGLEDRVIDSRASGEGESTRRRRECRRCQRRYTTYERVEEVPRLVFKKDGRSEPFSRQKILQGLLKACEKRFVSLQRLEAVLDLVENRINERFDYEVESRFIGEILMEELKKIDQVAYVRFASVYREFADVTEFIRELGELSCPNLDAAGLEATAKEGDDRTGDDRTGEGLAIGVLSASETGATRREPLGAEPRGLSTRVLGEAEGAGDRHQASTDTG